MDAQEFRSLQEAYEAVYENQQLDEALTGERYKKVMKKPGGTAYSRKVSEDPSKRGKRGGKGGVESDFGSPDRGSGNKAARRAGTYQEEEVSVYDIILSHLLDEGYAETPEAAYAILENMGKEWKQSIVEEMLDEGKKEFPSKKVSKKAAGHEMDFIKRGSPESGRRARKMKAIASTVNAGDDPRKTMHGQDLRKLGKPEFK